MSNFGLVISVMHGVSSLSSLIQGDFLGKSLFCLEFIQDALGTEPSVCITRKLLRQPGHGFINFHGFI